MKEQRCKQCGSPLELRGGAFVCPYCGAVYSEERPTIDQVDAMLDAKTLERLAAAKRVLYDATHTQYPSTSAVLNAANEVLRYSPNDALAQVYIYSHDAEPYRINSLLAELEATIPEAKEIIQWMIPSLHFRSVGPLKDFASRHFRGEELTHYLTLIEDESYKLDEGVYETNLTRDVFLCYSSADMPRVLKLLDLLEENGIVCFAAFRNLRHGKGAADNYLSLVKNAMKHCRVLVFLSSQSSRSVHCDAVKVELPFLTEECPDKQRIEYLLDEPDHVPFFVKRTLKAAFPEQEWCRDEEDLLSRIENYLANPIRKSEEEIRKEAEERAKAEADARIAETNEKLRKAEEERTRAEAEKEALEEERKRQAEEKERLRKELEETKRRAEEEKAKAIEEARARAEAEAKAKAAEEARAKAKPEPKPEPKKPEPKPTKSPELEEAIKAERILKANVNNGNYPLESKIRDVEEQLALVQRLAPEEAAQLGLGVADLQAMLTPLVRQKEAEEGESKPVAGKPHETSFSAKAAEERLTKYRKEQEARQKARDEELAKRDREREARIKAMEEERAKNQAKWLKKSGTSAPKKTEPKPTKKDKPAEPTSPAVAKPESRAFAKARDIFEKKDVSKRADMISTFKFEAIDGNGAAAYYLGLIANEEHIWKDIASSEAVKWMNKAEKLGYPNVDLGRGYICLTRVVRDGGRKYIGEGFRYLEPYAQAGNKEAQCYFGMLKLIHSQGVDDYRAYRFSAESLLVKDLNFERKYGEFDKPLQERKKEAVAWFTKSAEQGFPLAARYLGECFAGGIGTEQDFASAKKWLSVAMEANVPHAAYAYARNMYGDPKATAKDKTAVFKAFSAAHKINDRMSDDCYFWLGRCYEIGYGVAKDLPMAVFYYDCGKFCGDLMCKNALKNIGFFAAHKARKFKK